MKKIFFNPIIIAVILVAVFFIFNSYIYTEKQPYGSADYKNAEFDIGGERIRLGDEFRYFGNDLVTDLNNDGREDVAFIITQDRGSEVFFYAVAALKTDNGYVGTDGYLLGDRIAPQSTNLSQNPRHKYVVVFNYADRAPNEAMTARPSIGKSVYLKIDSKNNRWAIVVPDFEGESM